MVQADNLIQPEQNDEVAEVHKDGGKKKTMRHGGTFPSGLMLSKAAIGAGVLTIATHSAQVGLTFNTIALIIGGVLTSISINQAGEVCLELERWSFEDMVEELFHWSLSILTGLVNALNCLGSATGYLIVCGQVAQTLFGITPGQRQIFVVVVGIVVCLPLALARHINFMRYLAMASVLALIFLVCAVVYILCLEGVYDDVTADSLMGGAGDENGEFPLSLFVASLNNIVFAYNNQFNVPQIAGELDPRGLKRVRWMGYISSGLSFTLYWFVSLFGVLAFGMHQQDSLVVDFKKYNKNPLVICSLLAVGFSVLTCFEMHIYPVRQFCAYSLRKIRGMDIDAEGADNQWNGISYTRWLDIVCAIFSVAFAIIIAVQLTKIKALTDLIGAFASGYIAFVVPPACLIKLRHRQGGVCSRPVEFFVNAAMLCLGGFFVIYGTYTAVQGFSWD